jgi:hypothetical protein
VQTAARDLCIEVFVGMVGGSVSGWCVVKVYGCLTLLTSSDVVFPYFCPE